MEALLASPDAEVRLVAFEHLRSAEKNAASVSGSLLRLLEQGKESVDSLSTILHLLSTVCIKDLTNENLAFLESTLVANFSNPSSSVRECALSALGSILAEVHILSLSPLPSPRVYSTASRPLAVTEREHFVAVA